MLPTSAVAGAFKLILRGIEMDDEDGSSKVKARMKGLSAAVTRNERPEQVATAAAKLADALDSTGAVGVGASELRDLVDRMGFDPYTMGDLGEARQIAETILRRPSIGDPRFIVDLDSGNFEEDLIAYAKRHFSPAAGYEAPRRGVRPEDGDYTTVRIQQYHDDMMRVLMRACLDIRKIRQKGVADVEAWHQRRHPQLHANPWA